MNVTHIVLFLLGFTLAGCASAPATTQTDEFFFEQLYGRSEAPQADTASAQPRLAVRPLPLTIKRRASPPEQTPAQPRQAAVQQTQPTPPPQPSPKPVTGLSNGHPRPAPLLAFGDLPFNELKPENHPPLNEQEIRHIQAQLADLQQAGEDTEKYQAEVARAKTQGGVMAWFYRRWVPY